MKKPRIPKYHRQRFLLLFLEVAGGYLSKLHFQKLLFLLQKEAGISYYDFVPYHYGCYSFQVQADIKLLETSGWIEEKEKEINLLIKSTELGNLYDDVLSKMDGLIKRFPKDEDSIVKYVYAHYPYYAIRSQIAKKVLDHETYAKICEERNKLKNKAKVVYTIGYEGLSFESYINLLLKHDVRLLCDVRKNPLSRKFNFSTGSLSTLLPKFDIEYLHLPDLGVRSDMRQGLNSADDYAKLFRYYKASLSQKTKSLQKLKKLLKEHKRIALTCYEKDHRSCHRHCISDFMANESGANVIHIYE